MNDKMAFTEAEFTKISLNPGDVLAVKVTSNTRPDEYKIDWLKKGLQDMFPQNEVVLFFIRPGEDIAFSAIESLKESVDCSVRVCDDCSCGKAAMLKGE